MAQRRTRRATLASLFVKAFDQGDADAAIALMCKYPVWEFAVGPTPAGARYVGVAAVRNAMNDTFRSNPGASYRTIRSYSCSDSVIQEIHVQCRAKKLNLHALDIFTFNNADEIVSKRTYRKIVTRKTSRSRGRIVGSRKGIDS